jgi:hypothetical protein
VHDEFQFDTLITLLKEITEELKLKHGIEILSILIYITGTYKLL